LTQRTDTLVVHTGGIGDFLLACPAIARLAQEGPVALAGRPDRLDLAVAAGIARAAYDLDAIGFDSVFHTPNDRLRAFLEPFNRAVVWMRDDDGVIREALTACGIERVATFPGVPPDDWRRHAAVYYSSCLGYEEQPPLRLRLAPIMARMARYDVIIHPGSGAHGKNWPIERFEAVATALAARGREVTWCLGPAERRIAISPRWPVLQSEPLVAVGSALASAGLYIGNDSGITHLAVAVGCPTVAVFGPTDPRVWAPRAEHVNVAFGVPWPSVDEVLYSARTVPRPA